MLIRELEEAIDFLHYGLALEEHRAEQVNRILRWARAHWEKFEPELYGWLVREQAHRSDGRGKRRAGKAGRPPLGRVAMTSAERVRRYRARKRQQVR